MRTFALALLVWVAAAPAWAQAGGAAERIAALDLNRDGAITRPEAETARAAMFDRLDADGDGFISTAEQPPAQGGGRGAAQLLAQADADADGRISRTEMMNQPYRAFDRLDANNDGVLSADELEQVRGRRGGS